jgi:hypothetical protein
MAELKINKISPANGTNVTVGDSGDTFTIPSGASIVNSGTATGFGGAGSGGILQMICHQDATRGSDSTVTGFGNTAYTSGAIWAVMTTTITPSSANNYIYFSGDFGICASASYCAQLWVTYQVSGGSEIPIQGDLGNNPVGQRIENARDDSSINSPISVSGMFDPNTTSAITVRIRTGLSNSGNGGIYFHQPTNGTTDGNDGSTPISTFTVWEVAGSINPSIDNTNINS